MTHMNTNENQATRLVTWFLRDALTIRYAIFMSSRPRVTAGTSKRRLTNARTMMSAIQAGHKNDGKSTVSGVAVPCLTPLRRKSSTHLNLGVPSSLNPRWTQWRRAGRAFSMPPFSLAHASYWRSFLGAAIVGGDVRLSFCDMFSHRRSILSRTPATGFLAPATSRSMAFSSPVAARRAAACTCACVRPASAMAALAARGRSCFSLWCHAVLDSCGITSASSRHLPSTHLVDVACALPADSSRIE